MTFSLLEIAGFGSKPALLFEFIRGSTTYRYTSADRNITIGDNTFAAKPIKCGEMRFTGDVQADELTVSVPASLPMVDDFTLTPPQERVQIKVSRYHVGADPVVRWVGFVDRVVRTSRTKASVICTSLLAGLQGNGARLIWQRQCPHVVYSPGCGVNKADFAVTGVVTLIDGDYITAEGFADAGDMRLVAGFVEWTTTAGNKMWRAISYQNLDIVTLLGGPRGVELGMTMTAYPGCTRDPDGCALFDNESRYGGFLHLPGQSPYSGDPVF